MVNVTKKMYWDLFILGKGSIKMESTVGDLHEKLQNIIIFEKLKKLK